MKKRVRSTDGAKQHQYWFVSLATLRVRAFVVNLFVLSLFFNIGSAYNSLNITANWSLDFYKKIISPLQGHYICNFSPTCSQFYKQSINKYGIVIGSLMGADRLMRCNPWAWTYLDKYYYGIENNRIYNPPENHHINVSNIKNQILNIKNVGQGFSLATQGLVTENGQRSTDNALAFADYLFQQKDYQRAVGEYKRLLFFYPDTQNNIKEYITFMLGESYLKLKDYQQAFSYFSLQDNPYYNYNRARVYFEQGDYLKTREELNSVIEIGFNEKEIVLYGLSYYKEHDFSNGAKFLQQHLPRGPSVIDRLYKYDGRDIKKRSRVASTVFSAAIPGLGQVYSGRWGDGIYSFLTVVGSGLIANYYYHHDDSKIKFSIFSILTAFFWAGNVYGANIAARDYNTYQVNKYLKKIEDELNGYDFTPEYSKIKY